MRVAVMLTLIVCALFGVIGCGEESKSPAEPVPEIVPGLSGDTYMNTKFGIKISNLPVDEWTVKALGEDSRGLMARRIEGFLPYYTLLLMEPVPAYQFIDMDVDGFTSSIIAADIPFIILTVDYDEGRFVSYNLSEEINQHAAMWELEIESKNAITVENGTGIQAILLWDDGTKEAMTCFAKTDILVRCTYYASSLKFVTYYPTYIQVVENMWLYGR